MPAEVADYILVLHGLFGCDTTDQDFTDDTVYSAPNEKIYTEHLDVFVKNDSSKEEIEAAGQALIAHRYNCKLPLNTARTVLYNSKCTTAKKKVNLASLPPTEDAAKLHSLRAYHQIQEWQGNVLPPLMYGCKCKNNKCSMLMLQSRTVVFRCLSVCCVWEPSCCISWQHKCFRWYHRRWRRWWERGRSRWNW